MRGIGCAGLALVVCMAAVRGGWAGDAMGPAGRERGLCVLAGGDVALAAALHGEGRSLVLMRLPEAAGVAPAREQLQAMGILGPVSVEEGSLARYSLMGGMANRFVIPDPVAAGRSGLSADETLRVLCPGGAALVRSAGPEDEVFARALQAAGGVDPVVSNGWLRLTKPRPAGHDDWTHPAYDAGGCKVSRDQEVGPPERLQWLAGPVFSSMGDHKYGTILSAGGRNYYALTPGQALLPTFSGPTVADDPAFGLPQVKRQGGWLLARDAYNGLPIWRRAYDGYSGPLVADSRQVYAIVAGQAAAIDGESGKVVAVYGRVDIRAGLALKDGVLLVSGSKELRAYDTRTGKPAWSAPLPDKARFLVEGSRVIVFDAPTSSLSALELATGTQTWKVDCSAWFKGRDQLLFGRDGLLVFDAEVTGKARHVTGVSARDGQMLWTWAYEQPPQGRWTVLHAGGRVWIQKWMIPGAKDQQWEGLDPATGRSLVTHTVYRTSNYGCHPDVATDRYMIFNRPADFMAWADGKVSRFRSSRPACRHGATLGNGLFYSAPNNCLCIKGVIHGFVGIASAPIASPGSVASGDERLRSGTAVGRVVDGAGPGAGDWPTFRRDAARSGSAPAEGFTPRLKPLWKTPVATARAGGGSLLADEAAANWTGGEPVTAPTVSGGRVFVALPDRHGVVALDATTGRRAWSATVGGRMDVPPTLHGGLCLAGARDGWVYALGDQDGQLAWRFRAAPEERRMVAFGQLESPWPVVGGVLVHEGRVYALSGRSSESDGGIGVCCLEPATGKLLWETRPPNDDKGFTGLADLLVADRKAVSCGGSTHCRLEPGTGKLLGREILDTVRAGSVNGQYLAYIGSASTLLDRSWQSCGVSKSEGRFQTQWKDGLIGQIVVFDGARAVASQLRTADKQIAGVIVAQNRVARAGGARVEPLWKVELPAGRRAVALALAGEHVLAGVASADRKQGSLVVLAMKDGEKLAEYDIGAAPAAEGLAVVGRSVYLSTWVGEVLCLGPAE